MSLHIAKIGVEHVAYYLGQTRGGGGPSPAVGAGGGSPTAGGGSCGGGHGEATGGAPRAAGVQAGLGIGWSAITRVGAASCAEAWPAPDTSPVAPTTLRPDKCA